MGEGSGAGGEACPKRNGGGLRNPLSGKTYFLPATKTAPSHTDVSSITIQLIRCGAQCSWVAKISTTTPASPSPSRHTTVSINHFACSLTLCGIGKYSNSIVERSIE